MLEQGQDNALLRFALGGAFLKYGKYDQAAMHLARALEFDPGYSAAWKLYGKALEHQDKLAEAGDVYRQGIKAAKERGDMQAAREMEIFLKRLQRRS